MTILKLKRTNEYSNSFRDYKIFIDGKNIGEIANGETKEFEISPGQHTIIAKIDWGSSPEVILSINENETRELKVGGFKNGNWMIILLFLMPGLIFLSFILNHFCTVSWLKYLALPYGILLFYYITIGRKKYLTLASL